MSYEPITAAPYAIASLSNRGGARKLHPHWANPVSAEERFRGELFACPSLIAMLRFPMGSTDPDSFGEPCASAQWWGGDPWQRDILSRVCREWLAANPLRQLWLYMASRQRTPDLMAPTDIYHDLDAANPQSVRWFLRTAIPWIVECGASRIVLDAACKDERWEGALSMAEPMQDDYGVTLAMEAVRLERDGNEIVGIDPRPWDTMPYFCTNRFVLERDNFAARFRVPDSREGVIVLTGHEPQATAENVAEWRANKWVVGTMHRKVGDPLVFPDAG